MSGESAYSFRSVSFAYNGRPIVDDLSVDLPLGRMVALIGPNGEGKTTILRLLLGLLRPAKGSVSLLGRALNRVRPEERARTVAYLPQSVNTEYPFTVAEVVLFGRYPRLPAFALESHADWLVAERCMARTGVADLSDRLFSTLSGGEKQRVLIASVLAQEPTILLLDEPTASLDLHHQFSVMELLRELNREGMTILFVTHDVTLAAGFCDSLWLLSRGRVFAQGAPQEVVTEENLERLYGMGLRVVSDEMTGLPVVLPRPREELARCG